MDGVGGGIDGWNQLCDDSLTWSDLVVDSKNEAAWLVDVDDKWNAYE